MLQIRSFAEGHWVEPGRDAGMIPCAITGAEFARAGGASLDFQGILDYARTTGGPALQRLSFFERAKMLKALAAHLNTHKQLLYDLSFHTGATRADHLIDIDGGIGTMFVFASKGRREMPDGHVFRDGGLEQLSRNGTFLGQHICTSLQGAALHINAFNFPVWGMLEKLAPSWLAGVPAIVKPATASCYVTERCVQLMLDSGLLPKGALQLICGGVGDMFDRLTCQDIVSFTGSAQTARQLRSHPNIQNSSIRFIAEQDSLNASILGSDILADSEEFALFVKEICREMTMKAGQKCTAIRRIIVPANIAGSAVRAIAARLSKIVVGDPRLEHVDMGALISKEQREDVLAKSALIGREAERVIGDPANFKVEGAGTAQGAFLPPMLFHCSDARKAASVHEIEAFGPVATIIGYDDIAHGIALANSGQGSLVASLITRDVNIARQFVMGAGAFHGRLYINNRDSMGEATGHGSPLPHMVHGGPGRAGGGEELGGLRAVMHYMQRTAIQGPPDMLSAIGERWVPGAREELGSLHPFKRGFNALAIGETLHTRQRLITLEDIEHFAEFTGDKFYAHMDEAAAKRNPFFTGRVAHGYLLLSFAAGLFVDADEGPVLANTGLDKLRFLKPVQAGEKIGVRLTVMDKSRRTDEYGEVRWHVSLFNQDDESVAEYELLTMNAY